MQIIRWLVVLFLILSLGSVLLCRSRQEGSQGPVPEAWTALGDIGAHLGGLGFWDGWNRLDVEPSRIIVLPGPLIGPGMPPRRGEFLSCALHPSSVIVIPGIQAASPVCLHATRSAASTHIRRVPSTRTIISHSRGRRARHGRGQSMQDGVLQPCFSTTTARPDPRNRSGTGPRRGL